MGCANKSWVRPEVTVLGDLTEITKQVTLPDKHAGSGDLIILGDGTEIQTGGGGS